MSYSLRNFRHRNPKGGDEKKAGTPFFQPQSNKVSRKKKKETIQRLATSKEDEKLSTNDARMEKDKEEPMKPVQRKEAPKKGKKKKEEKKSGTKSEAPEKGKKEEGQSGMKSGKKEEEKPVQKMDKKEEKKPDKKKGGKDQGKGGKKTGKKEEEKAGAKTGKKEEEKPVQKKEKHDGEQHGKKKEEKETTSAHVAEEIKKQAGKGRPLPPNLAAELSKSMGVDMSGVSIHTDEAAARLCQQLHALAFTHGRDIYFDTGRYNPESPEGMKLLVHELAHVAQQSNTEF